MTGIVLLAALARAGESGGGVAEGGDPPPPQESEGVHLGSYGRVVAGTTTDGGSTRPVAVATPTRTLADPYLELDVAWTRQAADGTRFDAVVTPALVGALFHQDGAFDGDLTLRNLYAEASAVNGWKGWAGSRMVRGDDVYLLDTWPLDNLNLVGGGGGWSNDTTNVRAAFGLNRLDGGHWQYQTVERIVPGSVGTERVTVLDRQRAVAALTADHALTLGSVTLRPRVHGELHALPAGTRRVEDDTVSLDLPSERGVLLGGELSAWGWAPDSHVHVFVRHATGIAATGLLNVPLDGLATDRSVNAASESVVAFSANQEFGRVGLAVGLLARTWQDADGQTTDVDDGSDVSLAIRPAFYPTETTSLAVELDREVAWRDGPDARSGSQEPLAVTRVSLLPALQLRPGTFGRPQVRLQYTLSRANDAALAQLDPDDVRAQHVVTHWLGVGAEWWLDSRSYR